MVFGHRPTYAPIPCRADDDRTGDNCTDNDELAASPGQGRQPTPGRRALAELVGDASQRERRERQHADDIGERQVAVAEQQDDLDCQRQRNRPGPADEQTDRGPRRMPDVNEFELGRRCAGPAQSELKLKAADSGH
jgi:hypothetical protein